MDADNGSSGRLLTTREVAGWLGVSAKTVLRWTRGGGELPGFRLPGGALRFDEADLEAWLDARSTSPSRPNPRSPG